MSLGARVADALNPLVVLELRRGLRTRAFSIIFSLLLAACTITALIAYASYQSSSRTTGRATFLAIYTCLAVVAFFMLPYAAFRSLMREREEHTWPLLVLTQMRPRQLLAGRIGASLVQGALYASAVAPFLLFSYLMQGIDLITVAVVLAGSLVGQVFVTVFAVTAATFGETRLVRGAMHFFVLGALAAAVLQAVIYTGLLVDPTGYLPRNDDQLIAVGVGAWFLIAYGAVFFAVGVSRLTFEADNHALWPRLALLFHFAGTAALVLTATALDAGGNDLGMVVGILGALHAYVAGMYLASGPPGMSRRVRAQASRIPGAGLLLPGSSRGLRFFVLLAVAFAAVGAANCLWRGQLDGELTSVGVALALAVFYVSAPLALGRGPLDRWLGAPLRLRFFAVAFLGVGTGAPPLISLFTGNRADEGLLNLLNPIIALERAEDDFGVFVLLAPLAAAVLLVAHQVLLARDREAERRTNVADPPSP